MNTTSPRNSAVTAALNDPATTRRRGRRMIWDKIVRHSMTVGGISVIIAIVLIFFYLLYVVFPLLVPASMERLTTYTAPAVSVGHTLHMAVEEKSEVGVRFTDQAHVIFFNVKDGSVISNTALPLPAGTQVTSFAVADAAKAVVAFGLSNGQALVIKHVYDLSFPEDEQGKMQRIITPRLQYPMGKEPYTVDEQGQPLIHLAVQTAEENNTLAAVTKDNRLVLAGVTKTVNFLTEEETLESIRGQLSFSQVEIRHLLLDKEQRVVYLADATGQVWRIDVRDKAAPEADAPVKVVSDGVQITALRFLTGDISVLIGDSTGRIAQWFPVRNENGQLVLTEIRSFHKQAAPITHIEPEERRKGFVAIDQSGTVGVYHTTAQRNLLLESITNQALGYAALAPRADTLLVQSADNNVQHWHLHNEHPEISIYALWGKVWYENHEKPKYIWQSSSASNDFEPKFSLMPLAFGTLKAAFYAMLFAVPIAIFGAVYTAYFMSPGMRAIVKPTIEIMEALPTVILGFLAGLWLAPVVEANLPGIFALLLITPFMVILTAYVWRFVPKSVQYAIPEGWQAALLIPPILIGAWIALSLGPVIESFLFDGNMRQWLNTHGINFDQRNSLVVGMAMGLAVIPSIFSITEDAIFSVPKHLTSGSLALGATAWQTMSRVVILTASPGIFSAVMIGMGRAVGETMIVLMATGNTAVMDFSIFQGLRTMSANIAVEMPESEVGSTHFRILFLSGLVLFMVTFFFNTLAEIVRHRLRRKYSSL